MSKSDIMAEEMCELTSTENGATIAFSSDDYYGVAENLLKPEEPVLIENKYTEFGRWMDGWETRRNTTTPINFTIIRLPAAAVVHFVCIDLSPFTNHYPQHLSVQGGYFDEEGIFLQDRTASRLGTYVNTEDIDYIEDKTDENWFYLVACESVYAIKSKKYFKTLHTKPITHIRLNILKDGGVARLRVFGKILQSRSSNDNTIDLVSRIYNSKCIFYSNCHYGHPTNLIKPLKATSMSDGWETAKNIANASSCITAEERGEEWVIFKLGHVGQIRKVTIDTRPFKENVPKSIKIEGVPEHFKRDDLLKNDSWQLIIPDSKITPNNESTFLARNNTNMLVEYVKLSIKPDGAISRFRVYGVCKYNENNELYDFKSQALIIKDKSKDKYYDKLNGSDNIFDKSDIDPIPVE